jgi:hypothetical protein
MEYLASGIMTRLGRHEGVQVTDLAGAARVVQGLLIHEGWAASYGVSLTDPETVHIRAVSDLLDAVVARDDRPLKVAGTRPGGRPPPAARSRS